MTLRTLMRRAYFTASYHLHARRRMSRIDETRLFGNLFLVPPGVFHPDLFYSSKALGGYLSTLPLRGKAALDMGCGSGILAVLAAREGASVTAIDINPLAVRATRENASRNNVSVLTLGGNLFDPLAPESRFDYIFFNPPFYAGTPKDVPDMAWRAGESFEVMRGFLSEAPRYLRSSGSLILVLSSEMPLPGIADLVCASGFSFERVRSKRAPFEQLHIYRASLLS
jgi:release factor glutamine methyltransferase